MKQPIWIKTNFIGKYNGIKFRFTYSEHTVEDVDTVIKKFRFQWPGRVPENIKLAEEGISALFTQIKNTPNSSIKMEVAKEGAEYSDEAELETLEAEIEDEVVEAKLDAEEDMQKEKEE
jgi:hypothetical protein